MAKDKDKGTPEHSTSGSSGSPKDFDFDKALDAIKAAAAELSKPELQRAVAVLGEAANAMTAIQDAAKAVAVKDAPKAVAIQDAVKAVTMGSQGPGPSLAVSAEKLSRILEIIRAGAKAGEKGSAK